MTDHLIKLVELAIDEDVGPGDVTTDAIVPDELSGEAVIRAKEDLVVAGVHVAELVFKTLDSTLTYQTISENGSHVKKGDALAKVSGRARSLLTGERIALTFLQHLSGIATFTARFVDVVKQTDIRILDTRKTRPGYRALERYAVRMGDGTNHRMGLFDRYLIKNNHIEIAGSISRAIGQVNKERDSSLLLEVEARDLNEVEEIISCGADIIMLDNFSIEDILKAKTLIRDRAKIEVSGNITLSNLVSYAECGVDYISIGALTHSAPAADIHMVIS